MKKKLLVNRDGIILNVLPIDHKWAKRDLESGRHEVLVDGTEAEIDDMRKRRMIEQDGKLAMRPEADWPENVQANTELKAEVERELKKQIEAGTYTKNADGSWRVGMPVDRTLEAGTL